MPCRACRPALGASRRSPRAWHAVCFPLERSRCACQTGTLTPTPNPTPNPNPNPTLTLPPPPGVQQQSTGMDTSAVATLAVVGYLVDRLGQRGMCDSAALCALAGAIDRSGGSHALWTFFQQWAASACAQRMISVGKEGRRGTGSGGLFIPPREDLARVRTACLCYRLLGYNQHVERIRGLPIVMARAGGAESAGSVTTASMAEDLLHLLLGFAALTLRHLVLDFDVCVAHARQHDPNLNLNPNAGAASGPESSDGGISGVSVGSRLAVFELEKQRCLCVHVVADILSSLLEAASLLLPLAGDVTLAAAGALSELTKALVAGGHPRVLLLRR